MQRGVPAPSPDIFLRLPAVDSDIFYHFDLLYHYVIKDRLQSIYAFRHRVK